MLFSKAKILTFKYLIKMKIKLFILMVFLTDLTFSNIPILKNNGLLSYNGNETQEEIILELIQEQQLLKLTVLSDNNQTYNTTYDINAVKQFRFVNKQHMDVITIDEELSIPTETIHYDDRIGNIREMEAMLNLVTYIDVTHKTVNNGFWDDPNTWGNGLVPATGARVLIAKEHTVTIRQDEKNAFKTVRVDGVLKFDEDKHTVFRVNTMVVDMGGHLIIGNKTHPIAENASARIIFSKLTDFEINNQESPDYDPHRLGLGLISHGVTSIYGTRKTGFTTCNEITAGASFVVVDKLPQDWNVGDKIAIAGVTYDGKGDESRLIASLNYASNTITFDKPLEKEHKTLIHTKADLQLKIHIINLTRNVTFETSDKLSQRTIKKGIDFNGRGHIMFMHTNDAAIHYVAFKHLGRTDKQNKMIGVKYDENGNIEAPAFNPVARYPVHFHRAGSQNPGIVEGCAVEDSPGWGYVNHSSYVHIKNNVLYNVRGAGFVSEAGNEKGSFINNIAIRTIGNGRENLTASSKFTANFQRNINNFGSAGDGFWFHSSDLEIDNNVASGFTGSGMHIWDQGIDGVDHKSNGLLTAFHINNTTSYGGHTALNISFVEAPIHTGIDARHMIKNVLGWNVSRGIRRKYSKHINFVNTTLLNDINKPYGDATSTHSNGRHNLFFNPYIEGFVRGMDFEHREETAGVYGGYINTAVNCYINIRHSRSQNVIYKDISFGTLTPEALATIDTSSLGFDGNQYNYLGFLAVPGKVDEGFVDPEPQTKDGKLSQMYIVNGTSIKRALLKEQQHPDYIPWTNQSDPIAWQNQTNRQLFESLNPEAQKGVVSGEFYELNEVEEPNSSRYKGIKLKGASNEELPYLPVLIDSIQDIEIPKGESLSFNLSEVFINPNIQHFVNSVSNNTIPMNVSTTINNNILTIQGLKEGASVITLQSYSDVFQKTLNNTFKVTVTKEVEAPFVEEDNVITAYNTPILIDVLANDSASITAIVGVTEALNGTLEIVSGNKLKYTPHADFSGNDEGIYTVENQFGGENTAKVTIVVKPMVYDFEIEVLEGTTITYDLEHSIDMTTMANYGDVVIKENTKLEYTQSNDQHEGLDQFTYTINGETGVVNVNIIKVNQSDSQEVELLGDGFESDDLLTEGWEHIQDTGSLVDIKGHHSFAYSGDHSLRVRKKGKVENAVSTKGYKNIKVSFARKTDEGWNLYEQGAIRYQWTVDQTNWNVFHTDNSYHENYEVFDYKLPEEASDNENFIFGIHADAKKNAQRSYIDIVRVTGMPIDSNDSRKPIMYIENNMNGHLNLNFASCDSEYKTIAIQNIGTKPLLLNNIDMNLNEGFELINHQLTKTILPGAFFNLEIKSNPNAIHNTGVLTFDTNDINQSSMTIVFNNIMSLAIEQNENILSTAKIIGANYQWYQLINGEPIAINGANSNVLAITASGEYIVKAIFENGCEINSDETMALFEELSKNTMRNKNFNIFPNPTYSNVTIMTKKESIQSIELYDLYGKKIWSKDHINQTRMVLPLNQQQKGLYFLKMNTASQTYVKKVIKL